MQLDIEDLCKDIVVSLDCEDNNEMTVPMAWVHWLRANGNNYRALVDEIGPDLPRLLTIMVPMVGSESAKASVCCFLLESIVSFLCSLPRYAIEPIDVAVSSEDGTLETVIKLPNHKEPEDISTLFSYLLNVFFLRKNVSSNVAWIGTCAIWEELEPWPRNAIDWIMWLINLALFVQEDKNNQLFFNSLNFLIEDLDSEELAYNSKEANLYMRSVLSSIQNFARICSWS